MDIILQSTIVSGQDDIVKRLYKCEQFYDKVDDSEKSDTISSLYKLASVNVKTTKDLRNENKIWVKMIDTIKS